MDEVHTRREFLHRTAQLTGSAAAAAACLSSQTLNASQLSLPRRRLGRTGAEVSIVGMGLAPLGMAGYSSEEFRATVEAALAEGVNYFDMQPDYGEAERYLAALARDQRERLFVVTKTQEKTKEAVLQSIRGSLDRLRVHRVDSVLLNNVGGYDIKEIFASDGALAGLKEARRRGQVRFLGISGHYRPGHIAQVLQSGEFDIVMAPFNFVDRYIYSFEQDILPVAEKHGVGVIAMKTLGGAVGLEYDTREQKAMLPADEHEIAIRYVLALPGMCSAVIGCKNAAEIRSAARAAREYRPVSKAELLAMTARGKQLAAQWGRHYPEG